LYAKELEARACRLSASRGFVRNGQNKYLNWLSTVAALSAASASATVASASAACGTIFPRSRFIHRQRAALEILLVEHGNRFGSILLRTHFHKAKPARPSGGAILHNVDGDDRSRLGEVVLQIVLGRGERQISNE
jgi:hypothetical protein